MKKNVFSILMMIVLAAALLVSFTGCSNAADEESAARVAELEAENAALHAQIAELTAEIENMKQRAALESWTLDATPWNDGTGATVTFTATPVNYTEGQKAALSVRMGDLEAESTNCVWNGTAFTGSVELGAADGYGYYCILTSLDGTQEEIKLNTPDSVTNETLVYLGSNLNAYANMIVEDWEATNAGLVIKSGYIQVQMPRLTATGTASVSKASLILMLNGQESSRMDLALPAGEGDGSYELALEETTFTMPAMADDYQLDLYLEVALSTGSTIQVVGGSWYSNNGELLLVVG